MSFSLCIVMGKFNKETLHKEENDFLKNCITHLTALSCGNGVDFSEPSIKCDTFFS